MAYEVEIKAHISADEYTQLKKRLASIAKDEGFYEKQDIYYKKLGQSDEQLRIRSCSVQGVLLTYKERNTYDSVEMNKEIELGVSDKAKTQALLEALGYAESFDKQKMVHLYSDGELHYELVEVAGLGLFIEVELVVEEGKLQEVEEAKLRVKEALLALGVNEKQIESKSYKKLLGYI
jgi:adenylate cyclase, class 2